MFNPYQLKKAKIIWTRPESKDTKLFRLAFVAGATQRECRFLSGQFVQIGLPGWGECPISICSSPADAGRFFELVIRDVGVLTHQLNRLAPGATVEARGPFGNGFDADKFKNRPLVLVGGGCGLAPLRSLILDYLAGRLDNTVLQIFYGCQNESTLLFKNDYAAWRRQAELNVILQAPIGDWRGPKGLVTDLFKTRIITPNSIAVLVGPPVMYKFVIAELKKRKLKDENIFLSLEKKMYCGVGVCQHCAFGRYYVCKDGPVFPWARLRDIKGAI